MHEPPTPIFPISAMTPRPLPFLADLTVCWGRKPCPFARFRLLHNTSFLSWPDSTVCWGRKPCPFAWFRLLRSAFFPSWSGSTACWGRKPCFHHGGGLWHRPFFFSYKWPQRAIFSSALATRSAKLFPFFGFAKAGKRFFEVPPSLQWAKNVFLLNFCSLQQGEKALSARSFPPLCNGLKNVFLLSFCSLQQDEKALPAVFAPLQQAKNVLSLLLVLCSKLEGRP